MYAEPADYRFSRDTITISSGSSSNNLSFAINITNDHVRESNETFQVKILPSVRLNIGTPSSATVTIIDYYGEYAPANTIKSNKFISYFTFYLIIVDRSSSIQS